MIHGRNVVLSVAVSVLTLSTLSAPVLAGPTLKIDETKWISIGGGLRSSFISEDRAAPNGSDRSLDFAVDSVRLYLNGQVHKDIKLTFNTEKDSANNSAARVLDAIVRIEPSDVFNVWLGRFLPPSDRSNLSGPYYIATWDFPIVQNYPALFAGRDDGAAAWGQTGGGMFKYQAGAFQGRNGVGTSNRGDDLLYSGRLTLNLWDPEPGYYNSSTYYGEKQILAFGLAAMTQKNGAGTAGAPGDFSGWNLDALMEKNLGAGTLSLEGAYYSYDKNKVIDAALFQGNGYMARAGYLFNTKVGIGKLMPQVRFQSLDLDGATEKRNRYDLELHYVIDGHNARVTAVYTDDNMGAARDTNIFKIGVQLQI